MNKHEKHERNKGGSGFLLGLVVGFLLATLLTTKKGRQILKELIDSGLEIFEEFAEDRRQEKNFNKSIEIVKEKATETPIEQVEEVEEVAQDIDSETTADDVASEGSTEATEEEPIEKFEAIEEEKSSPKREEAPKEVPSADKSGEPKEKLKSHIKKRLFRGIRKK